MPRSSLRRKMLLLKSAVFGLPLLSVLVVLRFTLPGLKEQYDLARFSSDAVVIERTHFRLYTHHEATYGAMLADGIESFFAAFLERYGRDFRLEIGEEKSLVYAFSSKEELEKFSKRELHDPLVNNGGFYSPGKREIAIVAKGKDVEDDLTSAFHEAVHMAFDIGLGPSLEEQLSPWLNEGLAVYFGDGAVRRDGTFTWGGCAPSCVRYVVDITREIEARDSTSLVKIVAGATQKDFTTAENSLYYGTSFLLVHFLMEGEEGAHRKRFLEYYAIERERGAQGVRSGVFYRTIGLDAEEFERRWRRHVRQLGREVARD